VRPGCRYRYLIFNRARIAYALGACQSLKATTFSAVVWERGRVLLYVSLPP
jgi:hypothetical protein